MNKRFLAVLFLFPLVVVGCRSSQKSDEADIFYILSTEVLHAYDDNGVEVYNACLTPQDTLSLYEEREFVREHYAGNMPFFAPYYEQYTFASLSSDSFVVAYEHAKEDIFRRFNEYITRENNGRNFVLMGFSQGAMLALDLLKEMPDSVYNRCSAVYMLGYRLSAEDVAHERVSAATDACSGNVVSFNSVMRADAMWGFVAKGAVTCINPLNWRTDDTPAVLVYDGDTATVWVDEQTQQLLVNGLDEDKYTFPLTLPGNLHHWDLLFYAPQIHENILLRTSKKSSKK